MTFPPMNADEHAQVSWPAVEPDSPVEFRENLIPPNTETESSNAAAIAKAKAGEHRMTLKDFVNISISMLGAQIAWTLELG